MARRASRSPAASAEPSADLTDSNRGERLQRVMADAGVASRRDCERLIESGAVEVNGHLVTKLPAWVDPENDRIVVNGRALPPPERGLYILLNKPTRTLTSSRDEPGADRRTVMDLVDHPRKAKLFPVGRLDYETLGLLILTNDGELANRMTHPRYGVPKVYRATVRGHLDAARIAELEQGIYLAERRDGKTVGAVRTSRVEVALVHADTDKTTLDITLREGRNRQVRRMLAAVDLPVKKLERIAVGPLKLKGVPRGAWRPLTSVEVEGLRRACGVARTRVGKSRPKAGAAPGEIPASPRPDADRAATTSAPAKAAQAKATKPENKPTTKPTTKPASKPAPKPRTSARPRPSAVADGEAGGSTARPRRRPDRPTATGRPGPRAASGKPGSRSGRPRRPGPGGRDRRAR